MLFMKRMIKKRKRRLVAAFFVDRRSEPPVLNTVHRLPQATSVRTILFALAISHIEWLAMAPLPLDGIKVIEVPALFGITRHLGNRLAI